MLPKNGVGMSPSEIVNEYELTEIQVREALIFYTVDKGQIDAAIASEQSLEMVKLFSPLVIVL